MHTHQVVVSGWQNRCRNLSDVNICFQRGSNEADCSIWLLCRVQKWNDICQGCWIFRVPAYQQHGQKCGTYLTGFGMKVDVLLSTSWLIGWAAFCLMLSNFDTRLNLWWIVPAFLPCMLIDEQKQLELHQCIPGHSRTFILPFRGRYRWQHGISLPEVGREICSCVKCLLMLVLMYMESCVMSLFHRNRLNQHFLQTLDDVHGKMCFKNNLRNGALEIDFSTTALPLLTVVCLI